MRIPYLQRIGVGLHIGVREVRWVELSLLFGGLPFERLRLRRYEAEPVVGGQQEAALQRLVERVQPRYRYVHTHVDPEQVRVRFFGAPAFDDDEDLDAWLAEQPARLLPAGSEAAAFVSRTAVVSRREEGARCFVALVRREVVEERSAEVERAGLTPLRVGTGLVEVSSAFVFEPDFETVEPVLIHAREGATVALRTRGAMPDEVAVLSDAFSPSLIGEVEARLGVHVREGKAGVEGGGRGMWATGSGADSATSVPKGRLRGLLSVRPLSSVLRGQVLANDAALAAALAVESLYPKLALVDVQDVARSEDATASKEKYEAQGALLGIGLFVLVLLLAVNGTTWGLQRQVEAVELRMMEQAETLAALTAERRLVDQRRRDLAAGRELVAERTDVARLMEQIGQAAPIGTWLFALRLSQKDEGEVSVEVSGYSLGGEAVGSFLENLERATSLYEVELSYSERVSRQEAERQGGGVRPQTRFVIRARRVD